MRTILVFFAFVSLVGCTIPSTSTSRPNALKVEISDSPLTVKFINTSAEPVRILKPLDGSVDCWIMPYYKLTVTDGRGQTIAHRWRCALYGHPYSGTKWPEDYLVTIPAGCIYSQLLEIRQDIPVTGTYTLSFTYVFEPDSNRTPGGRYPRNLWRGEVSSNPIEAHLKAVERE